MKKSILLVVLIVALCFGLTGCNVEVVNSDTITVTDMVGDTVKVPLNPKKVACVSRTTYDLLIAFGLGDYVDGAYYSLYNNSWIESFNPKSKDEYHYEYKESYETFLSRGVDLVFAPEKYIADDLRNHGINALCISLYGVPQFDDYLYFFADTIKKLWTDSEVHKKVDEWKDNVGTAISDIKTELSKHEIPTKKIFYVRGDKNKGIGYTDTTCSFTEFAYRTLGFDFAGTNMQSNKPSAEDICKFNPDVFVIGGIYQHQLKELLKEEPYCNLDAVKNNQIFNIPVALTMFEQLSLMTPIFFYDQANKIYPEYFNYDINTMVKETIKKYFNVELTDLEVSYILDGKDKQGNNLK